MTSFSICVVDRDPEIFKDIVKHLQGYYVTPRDEVHFMGLLVDAAYYKLSKLRAQLRANYIINVGGKVFRVEQEILEKRDSPNFFTTIGFGYGWEPPAGPLPMPIPSIPPRKLDRDPELFSDILRYLQGYEIQIKDEVHRQNLLKDARYYHLRGLIEKLQGSRVVINGFMKDNGEKEEILFHLRDLRKLSVILPENRLATSEKLIPLLYKTKTKESVYGLLVEVHDVDLTCRYNTALTSPVPGKPASIPPNFELSFTEKDLQKLKEIAKSLKASEDIVGIVRSPELCALEIDGMKAYSEALTNFERLAYLIKTDDAGGKFLKLYVTRCILRLFINESDMKMEMEMVKCEAFSSERGFNSKREFLPTETKYL